VLPGDYTLRLKVTDPADSMKWNPDPNGNPPIRRLLGKLSHRLNIPDGPETAPVDLGVFTIPVTQPEAD
jgi:hypothetical protein